MSNPFVQAACGIVLVGIALVVFAFFAAVAMAIVDGIKRVRIINKIKRAQLLHDSKQYDDDLK